MKHKLEWPNLALILGTYSAWYMVGFWLVPAFPILGLALLAVIVALHSSVTHEACHGHPSNQLWLNELLVSANIGLIWPYRRYRAQHLAHHADERLTDPFDDPESYYRAAWQYAELPKLMQRILRVNNTLVGRIILGPILGSVGLFLHDSKALLQSNRKIGLAWLLHCIGLVPVISIIVTQFQIPLWLYVCTAVWGGLAIISLRTYAEHQWHEDANGRTIIVEQSPLCWLFLHNNLHVVHHHQPRIPWYRLPKIYSNQRAYWQELNHGYVFQNYSQLFRRYAFRAKEPIEHPTLRREK